MIKNSQEKIQEIFDQLLARYKKCEKTVRDLGVSNRYHGGASAELVNERNVAALELARFISARSGEFRYVESEGD